MHKVAAGLAIAFGVFLALAEAVRNWGDWQWWPYWVVDYVAVALLVTGGARVLRRDRGGPTLLAGAWGFTTAMFYASFWSHVEHRALPADGNVDQGPLTVVIGVLWVVTIVGFVLSLLPQRRGQRSGSTPQGHRPAEPREPEGVP